MDLTLSDEQQMLAGAAADFVERHRPAASAAGYVEEIDDGVWRSMADLGWTAIAAPDHAGGCANLVELAVLCEALGAGPLLTPLVASTLLAALPIAALGSPTQRDRWLPALASGKIVGTLALLEPGAHHEWAVPQIAGGSTLSGTKLLVPWADRADVVVVAANDGLYVIDPTDARCAVVRHDDLGEPMFSLRFDSLEAEALDGSAWGPSASIVVQRVLDRASVVELAYAVGCAERALALTLEHATGRHQFGRPIGSFQAVAHRCVDMRTDIDACRALVHQAAWTLEHRREADLEVAAALCYGKAAMRRIMQNAHQVHGAVGFSTEHPLHLLSRRAKAFELRFGTAGYHLGRVADRIGLTGPALP